MFIQKELSNMTVDFNKIKPGDTVVFRNGGTAKVVYIRPWSNGTDWDIHFDVGDTFDKDQHTGYNKYGFFAHGCAATPSVFDIVAVNSCIDWSSVKPGTKFRDDGHNTFYFIGPDLSDDTYVICSNSTEDIGKSNLTFIIKMSNLMTAIT